MTTTFSSQLHPKQVRTASTFLLFGLTAVERKSELTARTAAHQLNKNNIPATLIKQTFQKQNAHTFFSSRFSWRTWSLYVWDDDIHWSTRAIFSSQNKSKCIINTTKKSLFHGATMFQCLYQIHTHSNKTSNLFNRHLPFQVVLIPTRSFVC